MTSITGNLQMTVDSLAGNVHDLANHAYGVYRKSVGNSLNGSRRIAKSAA